MQQALLTGALMATREHFATLVIVHASPAGDFGRRALATETDILLI